MKNETVFTEFTLKFLMEEEISHQFSKGLLICELQICGAEVTKFSNRAGTIFGPRNFNVGGTLKNKLLSSFHINQPKKYNGGEPISIKTSIEDIHTPVTVETEEEGFYY